MNKILKQDNDSVMGFYMKVKANASDNEKTNQTNV